MTLSSSKDLTQLTLSFVFIAILVSVSFLVVKPFLGALVWAAMIVIATWSFMLNIQGALFGRRSLAVLVMTVGLLFVLIIPLWLAISSIVENTSEISELAESLSSAKIPPPPAFLEKVPFVGARLVARWLEFASMDKTEFREKIAPYLGQTLGWFVASVGDLGRLFIHFLLTVLIAGILYMTGERAAYGIREFARRIGGERGDSVVVLSAQAIRAVALGIVVTSLVQAVMAAVGFVIAGVPSPLFLAALVFLLCVVQIGAWLVLFPVIGWLYFSGSIGLTIGLGIWSFIIIAIDNIMRPLLIRKGADLPLLLIFAGVIGGLLAFGIIGLFIGPVVLAVTYTLLLAWVRGESVTPESKIPA